MIKGDWLKEQLRLKVFHVVDRESFESQIRHWGSQNPSKVFSLDNEMALIASRMMDPIMDMFDYNLFPNGLVDFRRP